MAKKSDSHNKGDEYSSLFEAELTAHERVFGRQNVLVNDEARARKYGIEVPSLALQYALASNVLFMEGVILLAGKQACHKSSMAFEIARWVLMSGGFARLYETEGKYSPGLAEQLIGDIRTERSWQVLSCSALDQWCESLSKSIRLYRDHFILDRKLKRGENRVPPIPACFIVDSLTGKATEGNIAAFEKEGQSQNVQGMSMAKAITYLLQSVNLSYMPWYVVVVRHLKKSADGGLYVQAHRTTGGAAMDFHGGVDLRMSVINSQRGVDWGYNIVKFKCQKNAFGANLNECAVRFSWQFVTGPAGPIQVPKWEWDLSTAEFLADCSIASVSDICRVERVSGTTSSREPKFNCSSLGLKGCCGDDLGMAVRSSGVMAQLQDALGINRWPVFDPAVVLKECP